MFYLDWLYFQHVKRNMFIGNPRVMGSPRWDRGIMDKFPGEHMICDMNGNGLKLSDLKDGMSVKIRARNIYFPGYEYFNSIYLL